MINLIYRRLSINIPHLNITQTILNRQKSLSFVRKNGFSTNKGNNQADDKNVQKDDVENKQESKQYEFSQQQTKLIKQHQIDHLFNKVLNLADDYNPQKQLILQRKNFQNSTKQLRSAILFQDLLKTQINILLYDTKAKPYFWQVVNLFYKLLSIFLAFYGIKMLIDYEPKYKILLDKTTYGKVYKVVLVTLSLMLFMSAIRRYFSFIIRYVETIHYDTSKQQFTMIKRGWFGSKKPYVMSRYKLLYTENPFLNNKKTNYFDIQTKQQFMIIYRQAWIKQDLFSHLISQRINI